VSLIILFSFLLHVHDSSPSKIPLPAHNDSSQEGIIQEEQESKVRPSSNTILIFTQGREVNPIVTSEFKLIFFTMYQARILSKHVMGRM
jgi:hypothetical protein